jgi:hypothetical protein
VDVDVDVDVETAGEAPNKEGVRHLAPKKSSQNFCISLRRRVASLCTGYRFYFLLSFYKGRGIGR